MRISDWSSDVCSSDLSEVVPLLEAAPGLRAVTVFEEMQRRHPELPDGVRRTMERRVRSWRALQGPDRDVIFRQVHEPGRMRSEERRVGKECVSKCRSRWSPYHSKKKKSAERKNKKSKKT